MFAKHLGRKALQVRVLSAALFLCSALPRPMIGFQIIKKFDAKIPIEHRERVIRMNVA